MLCTCCAYIRSLLGQVICWRLPAWYRAAASGKAGRVLACLVLCSSLWQVCARARILSVVQQPLAKLGRCSPAWYRAAATGKAGWVLTCSVLSSSLWQSWAGARPLSVRSRQEHTCFCPPQIYPPLSLSTSISPKSPPQCASVPSFCAWPGIAVCAQLRAAREGSAAHIKQLETMLGQARGEVEARRQVCVCVCSHFGRWRAHKNAQLLAGTKGLVPLTHCRGL